VIWGAIDFNSVIDVGCAIGDIVQGFRDRGKESFGLEGSPHAEPFLVCDPRVVFFKDLREDLEINMRFDLCTCLEVAEHIEKKYIPNFVANLVSLSDQLLLSIAGPGQGGLHHYTLEDILWWDRYFNSYGYIRDDSVAEKIIEQWEPYKDRPGIKAYYHNLHFYTTMKNNVNKGPQP